MIRSGYFRASLLAVAVMIAVPATAQEKTGNKPGFTLKKGTAKIVLMRPTIRVGEQSTGGMFEPNADWTTQARANIAGALKQAQASLGNEVIMFEEGMGADGALASQYGNLFGSLADSVIQYQFFRGNRLPTKVRKEATFDWSVGPGLAKLAALNGADYALFINTNDAYGSTGRKLLQFAGAMAGVGVTSGVHAGYAGLIDLKTGELVWLNADRQMGGDVRTAEGATKRVSQLLEGFPGGSVEGAKQQAAR
jgi:hypothetical protein